MERQLPTLNSLRSFETIGRHGSVAGAARELNVTEPAVSRALKNLEHHFGVNLFHRHTRGLELSEHGKILLPEVTSALDQVARASGLIYEQRHYSLSLLATPMISSHWVAPLISDFMSENADVSVRLPSSFRPEEIRSYEFDIAIWNFESERLDCDREHLFSIDRIPISSVKIAETQFQQGEIAALETASLLHEYDYAGWMEWFEQNGLEAQRAANGFVSDNFGAILQATLHDAGVALLFETYLRDPLFGHMIVAPFGTQQTVGTDYWLYSRNNTVDDRAVLRMKEFLRRHLDKG